MLVLDCFQEVAHLDRLRWELQLNIHLVNEEEEPLDQNTTSRVHKWEQEVADPGDRDSLGQVQEGSLTNSNAHKQARCRWACH